MLRTDVKSPRLILLSNRIDGKLSLFRIDLACFIAVAKRLLICFSDIFAIMIRSMSAFAACKCSIASSNSTWTTTLPSASSIVRFHQSLEVSHRLIEQALWKFVPCLGRLSLWMKDRFKSVSSSNCDMHRRCL